MDFLKGLASDAVAAAQTEVQHRVEYAMAGQDPATQELLDKLGVNKVIDGLKEALIIGIDKAVEVCGAARGYLGNPKIKIPIPTELTLVAEKAREVGLGQVVDSFEESMNAAAERSAPKALDIVKGAIREMTIDDVKRVWKGGDDAATQFLKRTCNEALKGAMRGECDKVIDENKVTHYYENVVEAVKDVPVVGDLAAKYDIRDYTLQKALDGLYTMMAEEESKIRKDPQHRTTELLSQVFASH